jgi:hypothetical protein
MTSHVERDANACHAVALDAAVLTGVLRGYPRISTDDHIFVRRPD